MSSSTFALLVLCGTVTAAASRPSQAPQPAGRIVGVEAFGHTVINLDQTVTFYEQAFGLELTQTVPKPSADAAIKALTNTAGAYRSAEMRLPGTRFVLRLMEFSGQRTLAKPRQTDPGQTDLLLRVRDVDAAFERLRLSGAGVITIGGKPVARGGVSSSVFTRDLDGYVIETVRGGQQPSSDEATGNVTAAVIAMTADDTDKKLGFYRDFLGLEMVTGNWGGSQTIMDMVGAGRGEFRQSNTTVGISGTTERLEFYEYRNVPEKTLFKPRLTDVPASMVSFVVSNIDDMVALAKSSGLPILTAGGAPVRVGTSRRVIVQDPDGVFVEFVQK